MSDMPTSGLHPGIPEDQYHQDGDSLSSTGAKVLLTEGPRVFKYRRDHPEPPKDAWDFGTAVHTLVLGTGADVIRVDSDSWRTKAAQEQRAEARAGGKVALLPRDYDAAIEIRDAVMGSELSAAILTDGQAEISMYATDPETGVRMRGRADYLRHDCLVDFKTAAGPVDPREWAWTVRKLRYATQHAWYQRILSLNGIDVPTLWIAVTKVPPYEVYVTAPDDDLMAEAHADVDQALRTYAACMESGLWPGLQDNQQIHTISDPRSFR